MVAPIIHAAAPIAAQATAPALAPTIASITNVANVENLTNLAHEASKYSDTKSLIFIGVSLAIFVLCFALRGVLFRLFYAIIKPFMFRKNEKAKELLRPALRNPVRFAIALGGLYGALQFLLYFVLTDQKLTGTFHCINFLFNIIIFWGIYNFTHPLFASFEKTKHKLGATPFSWLEKTVRLLVSIFFIMFILQAFGISVVSLVASLGIVGMAVALGAQDVFKNIIAGFMIIIEKRVRIGDFITLADGSEGVVERVGFRSTLLKQPDKTPLYVSNVSLSDGKVANNTKRKVRRIKWSLTLEYGTSAKQLIQIRDSLKEFLKNDNDFVKTKEYSYEVIIDELLSSAITVLIIAFTDPDWKKYMLAKEKLLLRAKEIVEDENKAEFAFPSQTVYVKKESK